MSTRSHFLQYELLQNLSIELSGNRSNTPILRNSNTRQTLPGQPWIRLTTPELLPYLRRSFLTESLNRSVSYLWLAGTPTEKHVSPLHHQGVRGRRLVVTEEPGLHILRYHDRIFVKPIPPYMLCRAFWVYISEIDVQLFQAAAGFMRTYCYLVRHEVDFRLAILPDFSLIPVSNDPNAPITFESFVRFISQFENLSNSQVAPRYSYGTLQLARINLLAPVLMGKWTYFHIQSQWTDYIGSFFPPLLTAFAIVSVILNAMQVELAVEGSRASSTWPMFVNLSHNVVIFVILSVVIIVATIASFVIMILLKELVFALSFIRAKKGGRSKELQAVIAA